MLNYTNAKSPDSGWASSVPIPGMLLAMSMPGRPNNASIGLLRKSNMLLAIHSKERTTLHNIFIFNYDKLLWLLVAERAESASIDDKYYG